MIDALDFGREAVKPVLDLQIKLAKAVGKKRAVTKKRDRKKA